MIEYRDFKLHVIFSMHKCALIRRIGLFLCRGWAQHIVDRWRDAVSPGSPPFASHDVDLLPCDISREFQNFTPQLLSKGNIVLIRNRKRASLLCACTAVLIYLDLR